jgi:hypothetical protein
MRLRSDILFPGTNDGYVLEKNDVVIRRKLFPGDDLRGKAISFFNVLKNRTVKHFARGHVANDLQIEGSGTI